MTQQLLAFGRKQVLKIEVLDLNHVVAGIDKLLRRLIGENVELCAVLGKEVRPIKANSNQLGQIIIRSTSIWQSTPGMPCRKEDG